MADGQGHGESGGSGRSEKRGYDDASLAFAAATAGRLAIDIGERLLRLASLYSAFGPRDQARFIEDIDYVLEHFQRGWERAKAGLRKG